MPKISNNRVKLFHKDIEEYVDIVINYNGDDKFYANFPNDFSDIIHHMDESEMAVIGAKYSYSKANRGKWIISEEKEGDCLHKMKKALTSLLDKRIEKRDVIILFYKHDKTCRYNTHEYNQIHPQIGIQIGLTYAVETSIGDKKVYSVYREYEIFNEKRTERKEITLWNEAATIIPDTPQNREYLEYLYSGFKELNEKMTKFTESSDSLMALIASNQKMLGE